MVAIKLPELVVAQDKDDNGSPFNALARQSQNFTTSIQKTTKKMSPVTFVDGQTKDYLKGKLHEKRLLLWRSCVEASLYCAVFHEVKRFLRDKTAKHRRLGPVVKYTTNVMLPDGLFGPIIGFVVRLKFFS